VIDSFVLLTPLLMLGVIALVRFVGCNQVFGLEPTVTLLPPVTNLKAVAGDQRVDLTWDYEPGNATSFVLWFHELNVGPYIENHDAQINFQTTQGQAQHGSASLANLPNGSTFFFKVIAHTAESSSSLAQTLEVMATPGATAFLSFTTPGAIHPDNFTGWAGMAVQMNADAIVTQLGRLVVANNVRMHDIKIIDPGQNNMLLGAVTVNMPAGPIGTFAYQPLAQPVALKQFRLYYFMAHEEIGDDFHDIMPVDTTGIGSIISGVYNYDTEPDTYRFLGSMNQTYGPVNFTY